MDRILLNILLILALLASGSRSLSGDDEIMPLSDVKSGMRGEWHTVVSGNTIESFELEVLGIADNFTAPQRAIIICRALDEQNITSGPVAGMSGSPVYIDGKLVGAYAYGYLWPKKQAIIGVTPIEQMLEIVEDYPLEEKPMRRSSAQLTTTFERFHSSEPVSEFTAVSGISGEDYTSLLKPLPTPLMMSGFSSQTLEVFRKWFDEMGLDVVRGPSSSNSSLSGNTTLEPGAPLAAVLMRGDFDIAATGTVTYRDGDVIIGFGHPFFQSGSSGLPLAGAEIITVVQSVRSSFKLSNTGPIVGSLYQDRLTGIAGKIGPKPAMIPLTIHSNSTNGSNREYHAELVRHPRFSPLYSAVALYETLTITMESNEEQTLQLSGRIDLEGYETIEFSDTATGPSGAINLAVDFLLNLTRLLDNPYSMPEVNSIEFEVDVADHWQHAVLREVHLAGKRIRASEKVELSLAVEEFQKGISYHKLDIPVPSGVAPGEELVVLIADAREASRSDGLLYAPAMSLEDIIQQWRTARSSQFAYIKLLRKTPGLRVEGGSMPALPPSVLAPLTDSGNALVKTKLEWHTLWESRIPFEGVFEGVHRVNIQVIP